MSDFFNQPSVWIVSIIKVVVLMALMMTALAYLSWFERKVVAHIQSRWGPYRVGPHGLLQPLADGLKFLFKEDPTPGGVDKLIYFLAPFLAMALALCSIAMIPFGPSPWLQIANVNIGLLVLFAITSLGVYGVALGGWASNSKYPLLGGLRSSAQMVSYELSMTMSVVGVVLMAGTFNLREIIMQQQGYWLGVIPRWNLLAPPFPQVLGFFVYFVSAIAETNRVPFDLPEAETELVAGFHTEYASFKFAMFFMAEYANMITVSCLATLLFFGGWLSPFSAGGMMVWTLYIPTAVLAACAVLLFIDGLRYSTRFGRIVLPILALALAGLAAVCALPGVLAFVQGPFWFLLKVFLFLFFYVWLRGTLPRFRYDQLMSFGWKLLLPLSIANVILTSWMVLVNSK
ncbi:MAG: NADH-quinone oxidoreductase subunit H [Acidobacteria bacterium]|nr:NADH-quinone oxidoreductase subunit H [Acidobacteriota bacterium]MCL5286811.1 NADH-quinone oxidoreductase subunit H [Acidobacteriota bacterium]